jgi:predicted nuclease with TOPRIM domain
MQKELEKLLTEKRSLEEEAELYEDTMKDSSELVEENEQVSVTVNTLNNKLIHNSKLRLLVNSLSKERNDLQASNQQLQYQTDEAMELLKRTQEKFNEMTALAERLVFINLFNSPVIIIYSYRLSAFNSQTPTRNGLSPSVVSNQYWLYSFITHKGYSLIPVHLFLRI